MRVKGSLAEWSGSAISYRGEMLGMLAVWVFLLAVEEYFHKSGMVGEGNKVSCDNKGALTTLEKSARGYQRPVATRTSGGCCESWTGNQRPCISWNMSKATNIGTKGAGTPH